MFGAGVDAQQGIPVVNGVYPDGEEGIQKSLHVMCRKIREGMATAVMKSFAGNVLKEYGFPNGVYARTAALLDFVRKHVAYAPDALGTEQIQSAAITLCVAGAPVCIPVGDCDDLVTALGTLVAALGMECRVTRQIFGGDHQQHVLLEVKDEKGKWLAADPSSKTMPVGRKAPAVEETYCSPWDPDHTGLADTAQFVGIGSLPTAPLPVMMLTQGAWHVVNHLPQRNVGVGAVLAEIAPGIEVDMYTGEIQVGLGHEGGACCSSCAQGKPCEGGCSSNHLTAGVSALVDDISAASRLSVDPVGIIKQFWAQIQGRSWQQAITAADARAESKVWTSDLSGRSDLITLAMSSAFNIHDLQPYQADPQLGRVSNALANTWYILLKRIGKAPAAGAKPQDYRSGATAEAEIPIAVIVGLVIASVAAAAILAAALYYSAQIIGQLIATSLVCDRELMRLHSEVDKIAEHHKDGSPLTSSEEDTVHKLELQQKYVLDGCVEALKPTPPGSGINWTVIGIVAGILGLTTLGVVYAPEIKHALGGRREY